MTTPLIIVVSILVILLIIALVSLWSIRKYLSKIMVQQSMDNEEILEKIEGQNELYRQQYTDMMSELVEYKDNVKTRIEEGWTVENDELYEAAKAVVIAAGKASTSYLQRKLGVGYSRAAHLMDMLEENEVVGPAEGTPRLVLVEKTDIE